MAAVLGLGRARWASSHHFKTLSKGLPQKHAYDLVFRHALDVDETGERLAFGSTTGSMFITENGGDSWQTISNRLPPVYAVRFEKPAVSGR